MQGLVNFMAHNHQNHKKKRILNEAGHFYGPAASEYLKKEKGKSTDTSIEQVYRQSSKVLRKINKAFFNKNQSLKLSQTGFITEWQQSVDFEKKTKIFLNFESQ